MIFLFLIWNKETMGQEISGRVTDGKGNPQQSATVTLTGRDGHETESRPTDSLGIFRFGGLNDGKIYTITVSLIGFRSWSRDSIAVASGEIHDLKIVLEEEYGQIGEISIATERPAIEKRLDRTVINPEALLSNTGGTAQEALEKSPGVTRDQNGNILLSGRSGVSVYLDDRPTYLTGEDLRELLRSIPVSQIDRIELMSNPPASYDAAGSGGIIVLHTKRFRAKGIHGGISLSYNQGKHGQIVNSADLGLNRQKWALSASTSFNTTNTYTDLDISRKFDAGMANMSPVFSQNTWIKRTGRSLGGRVGVDYFLDDKNTIGINSNFRSSPMVLSSRGYGQFLSGSNTQDSTINANNMEDRKFSNLGINANYRLRIPGSDRKLTVDLDYLRYSGKNIQSFDNTTDLPDGQVLESLDGTVPTDISIISAKTDYAHPLKKGLLLTIGIKSSRTFTDNKSDFFRITQDERLPDLEKTNHFRFRESIHSAYANTEGKLGKWNYQLGLRLEGTYSYGHQLGNAAKSDSAFDRRHADLFPTLFLQYRPSKESKHSASLNYGKRIERPHYSWLNPFVTPFDKYTYYIGTPYLRPSFIYQGELSYAYGSLFDLTLAYGRVRDMMSETIRIDNGIYYSQQGNLGSLTTKSATFNISYDPITWMSIKFHSSLHTVHTKSQLYGQSMDSKGAFVLLRPSLSIKATEKWTFQLDGEYQGTQKFAQFTVAERHRINAGITYRPKPSWTFALAMNDLLHSDINAGQIGYLRDAQATYSTLRDTRVFNLSLRYRFSKGAANERIYQGGGAQSEQQRT